MDQEDTDGKKFKSPSLIHFYKRRVKNTSNGFQQHYSAWILSDFAVSESMCHNQAPCDVPDKVPGHPNQDEPANMLGAQAGHPEVHGNPGGSGGYQVPAGRDSDREKAPAETYADIGGLDTQIQEIKESVELPLTHPEYYEEMGIKPPKGVILYGPPGTGKTLLAKAVANQTSATFLRVVGSELIQKYLGDGPKLVRELFRVAEDHSPAIVFIDEIDAVGTKRYDSTSGGEKEIQRTMLELLNQLDGFDSRGDTKVIMV